MWKEGNPLALLLECKLVQPVWRTVRSFLKKLKRVLSYIPRPYIRINLTKYSVFLNPFMSSLLSLANPNCWSINMTQLREATPRPRSGKQLCFPGAAVKRHPTSKVRETQVRR